MSSRHSALASLNDIYTDSEEETEDEIGTNFMDVENVAAGEEQNLKSTEREIDVEEKETSSVKNLVSYFDDNIDDEAVDGGAYSIFGKKDPVIELHNGDEDDEGNGSSPSELNESVETFTELVDRSKVKENLRLYLKTEPSGKCLPELQEKIANLYNRKLKRGLDVNRLIQRNKQFRNPSIYEKLIILCEIDEVGSNYPKEVYDPHEFHESSFYESLAKEQDAEMKRRVKS